jgi:hypothetical protein
LNPSDSLLTIAEISIAVIGFAGIVFALRPEESGAAEMMHRLRLRIMVEASSYVMALSFLPLVVLPADGDAPQLWRLGTALIAITAPVLVASIYIRQRALFGSALLRETILFDSLMIVLAIAVEAVMVLSALGVGLLRPASTYLLGLLLMLGAAVAMFIRVLFSSSAPETRR